MDPLVDPRLEAYALDHSSAEAPHLVALAAETFEETAVPQMMVGPLEGGLLALLVALVKPRLVLEIGTFTGYSALSMAAELPPEGRIITCEIDERHAEIARRHIAAGPHASRIEVRIGPASETIAGLEGPFDFVFIDADKPSNPDYFSWALKMSRPGTVIVVDNVVRDGAVADPASADAAVRGVRRLNLLMASEPRVAATAIQTVGTKGYDGFAVALVLS